MNKKIKVLMVDDEERFRATTAKILAKRGFDTLLAASGEEALEMLQQSQPDVVILDIKMPGMDGEVVLTRIKEKDPNLPVIMLTGHGTPDSAIRSSKWGAFDYLTKPCDIDLLAAKINDAQAVRTKGGITEEKKAVDIMIPIEAYTTIEAERTVKDGIKKLRQSFEGAPSTSRLMETGHRSILVFDRKGDMVGILSIVDLIRALQPSFLSFPKPSTADSLQFSPIFWRGLFTLQATDLAHKKIKDIMTATFETIDETTNLMEIAYFMFSHKIRRVAVTSGGKVIGVVREQEIFFDLANIILNS
ncbi:response regulator [candidate division CSSED10-310 bacterium]|uniref:Response regulator n=1 Tax=candidate division CSSED10-310 bacterium TaxID=2855610 RepID=A0ABV6Z3V4_UNCC1